MNLCAARSIKMHAAARIFAALDIVSDYAKTFKDFQHVNKENRMKRHTHHYKIYKSTRH